MTALRGTTRTIADARRVGNLPLFAMATAALAEDLLPAGGPTKLDLDAPEWRDYFASLAVNAALGATRARRHPTKRSR